MIPAQFIPIRPGETVRVPDGTVTAWEIGRKGRNDYLLSYYEAHEFGHLFDTLTEVEPGQTTHTNAA